MNILAGDNDVLEDDLLNEQLKKATDSKPNNKPKMPQPRLNCYPSIDLFNDDDYMMDG